MFYEICLTDRLNLCSLLRQASEHNLNLELAAGFTHKIRKNIQRKEKQNFHNDW